MVMGFGETGQGPNGVRYCPVRLFFIPKQEVQDGVAATTREGLVLTRHFQQYTAALNMRYACNINAHPAHH